MYDEKQRRLRQRAENLFDRNWFFAVIGRIWAMLIQQNVLPPTLADYTNNTMIDSEDPDTRAVRLEDIVGTTAKLSFDRHFRPLQRRSKARWVGIAMTMMSDPLQLPPVDLVQVGEGYYIVDGHHRVSVARALGNLFIDARVIEWAVD